MRFMTPAARSQIAYCVGFYHVSYSNRDVVRDMRARMRKAARMSKPYTRSQRKQVYREAIAAHGRNRALYGRVMRGMR